MRVGDRVFVWGQIDLEATEGAELKARGLVSLVPNGSARPAAAPSTADAPAHGAGREQCDGTGHELSRLSASREPGWSSVHHFFRLSVDIRR